MTKYSSVRAFFLVYDLTIMSVSSMKDVVFLRSSVSSYSFATSQLTGLLVLMKWLSPVALGGLCSG